MILKDFWTKDKLNFQKAGIKLGNHETFIGEQRIY
jgi:hypothetical protein